MGDKSGIEWTDATWNPIVGCSIVSPGCTNCYAMSLANRIEAMQPISHYVGTTKRVKNIPVWTGKLAFAPDHILAAPLRWKKPRKIFVNSMGDLFHEDVPDEWIDKAFAVMALCPQHIFQVLTKRSKRMREYCNRHDRISQIMRHWDVLMTLTGERVHSIDWPMNHVWLGVSAEDQTRADERIPDLLATPAAVRFVSIEPCLSAIDMGDYLYDGRRSSVSQVHRSRLVHDRSGGSDMATLGTARATLGGSGERPTASSDGEGRAELVGKRRLSESDVCGWSDEKEDCRTSNCLDDIQSQKYSRLDGDQPQGRQQEEQRSNKSGTGDAEREHETRSSRSGQNHTSESNTWSKTVKAADHRDKVSMGQKSDDPTGASETVRSFDCVDSRRDLPQNLEAHTVGISWIIVGGESGPKARPMHPAWVRSIRDQCAAAGTAFYFKQWGEWAQGENCDYAPTRTERTAEWWNHEWHFGTLTSKQSSELRGEDEPDLYRIGKKRAGRMLDGKTHNQFPEVK